MFRRAALILLLLVGFLAGGIVMYSRPSFNLLTHSGLTLPQTPVPEQRALLVLEGENNLSIMDAQTGQVLNRVDHVYDPRIANVSDGRTHYVLRAEDKDNEWHLRLVAVELANARTKTIPLTTFPVTQASVYDDTWNTQVVLSRDGRQLVVTLAEKRGKQWLTRVYLVDSAAGQLSNALDVFRQDVIPDTRPEFAALLSHQGKELVVAHNRQVKTMDAEEPRWQTQLAVVNVTDKSIERVVEVPGEVQSEFGSVGGMFSPDDQQLYLIQPIVKRNSGTAYRFVVLSSNTLNIVRSQQVESESEVLMCYYDPRLTSDGRFLYGLCPYDPNQPHPTFRFLDTQTGIAVKQVSLESQLRLDNFGMQILTSPDNELLYTIFPQSREIFVLDPDQQKILRHAALKDDKAAGPTRKELPNPLSWLAEWLVKTASAKFYPQPGALLSPDVQRLYFVGLIGFEKGDGIWGVETNSLQPLGHWLRGKDIIGIQISAYGRELYAIDGKEHKLYVLDALSGEIRRTFDQTLRDAWGFVSTDAQ